MIELSNYELQKPPNGEPSSSGALLRLIGLVVLVLLLVGVGYYLFTARPWAPADGPPAIAEEPVDLLPPEIDPLGQDAEQVDLPPLADTDALDALIRQLVGPLSARPELAALLTSDDLVRRFVVSIDNLARGVTPTSQARAVAPKGDFEVAAAPDGRMTVDPTSFDRYNGIAATIDSLDADALARLYTTLKPRFEEAYRELGTPDADFDGAVEQALTRLLETPDVTGPLVVRQGRGVNYAFVDGDLEALPAAQKQLIRMGPRNRAIVQSKLHELAIALGIPANRLPPRRTE